MDINRAAREEALVSDPEKIINAIDVATTLSEVDRLDALLPRVEIDTYPGDMVRLFGHPALVRGWVLERSQCEEAEECFCPGGQCEEAPAHYEVKCFSLSSAMEHKRADLKRSEFATIRGTEYAEQLLASADDPGLDEITPWPDGGVTIPLTFPAVLRELGREEYPFHSHLKCPDCGTWQGIKQSMIVPHRNDGKRDTAAPHCPASCTPLVMDRSPYEDV